MSLLSLPPARRTVRQVRNAAALLISLASVSAGASAATPPKAKPPRAVAALMARKAATKSAKSSRVTRRRTVARRLAERAERPERETVALPALPTTMAQLPTLEALLGGTNAAASAGDASAAPMSVASAAPAVTEGPLSGFGASAERMLSSMMERARSQLGTRYVFGGERPGEGLDCSSFARFAMEALGITLPRTAAQQARVGEAVPRDRASLRVGDLLTFGRGTRVSHVGIYLGEGRFIHASVKSGRIIETTIERNTQLFRRWLGARRLIVSQRDTAALGDG